MTTGPTAELDGRFSTTVTLDAPLGRGVVHSEPKGIVVPVSQG